MEHCSILCGSLDGKGFWGKMDTYMFSWVPLLFIWNYHNIIIQLYPNIKFLKIVCDVLCAVFWANYGSELTLSLGWAEYFMWLIHKLIFIVISWDRYYYHPHIIDEKLKVGGLNDFLIVSRESGLEPRVVDCRAFSYCHVLWILVLIRAFNMLEGCLRSMKLTIQGSGALDYLKSL